MRKESRQAISDAGSAIEELVSSLDTMALADMVDLAAWLHPIGKNLEAIDKHVKDAVREQTKHKDGTVMGRTFKAIMKLAPSQRLDQKRLKEEKPRLHDQFLKDCESERVTFELR